MRSAPDIRSAMLAGLFVLAGCDRESPSLSEPPIPNVLYAPCYRSMLVYCHYHVCSDYGTALTELRESAARPPCSVAQVGICGSYRVLVDDRGVSVSRRYFDGAGQLAAVTEESGIVHPSCQGLFYWGPRLDCPLQVVEDLCPQQ